MPLIAWRYETPSLDWRCIPPRGTGPRATGWTGGVYHREGQALALRVRLAVYTARLPSRVGCRSLRRC